MYNCIACKEYTVKSILNFGPQPISNRFLSQPSTDEFKHVLHFGYCQICYLAQLINPAPAIETTPRFGWIHYNEPEGHLDQVAEDLLQLPGVTPEISICGISGIEESLLNRLMNKGLKDHWLINLKQDLAIDTKYAGIGLLQERLDSSKVEKILAARSTPYIVIARYILEHAHDPIRFLSALRDLVDPNGFILIEVPDCTNIFSKFEYSVLWEEHVSYFTPYTFLNCLMQAGFSIYSFKIYPYALENSMVAIVKVDPNNATQFSYLLREHRIACENEVQRLELFSEQFHTHRERGQRRLKHFLRKGKISLLGAGHMTCHFINLLELKDYFEFIVDDHPKKIGLRMPGSQLPIVSSLALKENNIKTCLLSLNHESEKIVIQKRKDLLPDNGKFISILSSSEYSMYNKYIVEAPV